jgi:hypothetical protein
MSIILSSDKCEIFYYYVVTYILQIPWLLLLYVNPTYTGFLTNLIRFSIAWVVPKDQSRPEALVSVS